ncbi:unnamed protein product [Onchocerca ochengi]|uniref:Breast cancer type 2 susceptibility protein homolog n=1 Tax=Onchocerca ochengi TaxID=42157 RepID=A0A182EKH1_ONCOC|nr:unnamed protein product [Onchocerca ochengi]
MSENGKNINDISDEMSSLIHAAEEWANEQLIGTYSNDLNDSNSYPVYVPIEEVAREVALELCKIDDLDPETGTDNRLPKRNADDTTFIHQSLEVSTLHNIPHDAAFPSSTMKLNGSNSPETSKILSSTKHVENHPQKVLLDTFQSSTTACEDVNKTFIAASNTSLNTPKKLDIPDQITHGDNTINKTYAVRRNTSFNMPKKLDINKTFVVRRNTSLNMPEELKKPSQAIQDNSKQQSIAPDKVTLPIMDTIFSFAEDNSYNNKFSDVQNSKKNIYISSNGNCSNILNKKKMPKAKEYPDNKEQKLLSITPENSSVKPVVDTILSSITTTDYQEFPDNDLDTDIPLTKCSEETRKKPGMLTAVNPKSKNTKLAQKGINIINSGCSTASNTIIDIKDKVTISPPNEAITEMCMLTANKIIRPSFPKTDEIIRLSFPKIDEISRSSFPKISVNDADMRRNIVNENHISISTSVTEKEKNLSVIKSMQPNASRNNAFYHLEKNINAENTPQKQLIIDDEDTNRAIIITENRFVMDNQMQATPKLLLDEPIKSFESLPLLPRRKSLLTPRNILNFNVPAKSIQRSTSRHRTIREVSKPTIASEMKHRSKSINSVQPINPSKKPNELPLETRASRLKAEYLAKKRAEEANG